MNEFAKVFNRYVENLGLSNQRLAKVMGVHYTSIGRWRKETGEDRPTDDDAIRRFAGHYRLTTPELNELLKAAGFKPDEVGATVDTASPATLAAAAQLHNPFIVGQPVTGGHFFGREMVINNLYRLWSDFPNMPIQNAAIWGEKRIGKTSLLLQLKALAETQAEQGYWRLEQRTEKYAKLKTYNWIYVDFQNIRFNTQHKFLQYVLDNLHLERTDVTQKSLQLPVTNPLEQFAELLAEHLTTPTIILLDEVSVVLERRADEFSNEFWEGLRALSTTMLQPSCLGFVISSPKHPKELNRLLEQKSGLSSAFFNIFGYSVKAAPFIEQEALALINSSPIEFCDEDKLYILQQSQYKPHQLQRLCRERLDILISGGDKNDLSWQNTTFFDLSDKQDEVQ